MKPPALTMLEQAHLDAAAAAAKDQKHTEDDKAQSQAAAEAAKKVADILKKQDDLLAKAQNLANASQAQPPEHGTPDKPPPVAGTPGAAEKTPNSPDAQKQNADLAAAQKAVAEQTKAAADQARAHATDAKDSSKLKDAADKADAAARKMEEASRAFAAGKTDEGQTKAGEAKTALQEAGNTLQNTDRDKLQAAIDTAASHVALLIEKQQDLATQTTQLAKDLGDKAPDQRQQRDLQKQAFQQTQLGAATEALNNDIRDLNDRAAQVGEPETVRAMTEAEKAIKRGQPQAKMAGAVVDLNNAKPAVASEEQKNATDALQKIIGNLQAGSDALAANREAQLKRAARAAQDAKDALKTMMAKAGLQPKGDQNKPDDQHKDAQPQPGDQQKGGVAKADDQHKDGQPKPGDQQQGGVAKTDDQHKDGQPKPGDQQQGGVAKADDQHKDGQPKPGDQTKTGDDHAGKHDEAGNQAHADEQAKGPGQAEAPHPGEQAQTGGPNTGVEDDERKLAYNLAQLAAAVDNRDLIPQDQANQLKQMTTDKAGLEKKLATDSKFLQDVADLVSRVSDKIEAEMEAKTEAGKLFSSQREECPPNYRQFVNKYFEALSQVAPAPGQANKQEQPSQP